LKFVWVPPKSIYQHFHFQGIFKVNVTKDQFFFIDHFGQQIENELFWCGLEKGWERVSINLWKELCQNQKIIIDIGANSGLYSLVAKAVSPQSNVYAFEPIVRVYNRLLRNNIINGFNIHAEPVALSNYDGEGTVYDTSDNHILSVTVNKNLHATNIKSNPVIIPVRKLSTYVQEKKIEKIDLIKLDVETHEPEVLEGMNGLLAKFRPVLLVEVLSDEAGSRIQSLVAGLDYLYFDIDENSGIRQVFEIKQSSFYNYLLCQQSIAQNLGLI